MRQLHFTVVSLVLKVQVLGEKVLMSQNLYKPNLEPTVSSDYPGSTASHQSNPF